MDVQLKTDDATGVSLGTMSGHQRPVIARECGGKVTCRSAAFSMLPDNSGRSRRNGRSTTSSYGKVGNPGWPANSRNN
jgi:hypothetical protein